MRPFLLILKKMSKENMIKVVITQLGEQKLSKIIDVIGEDETNEFIPKCGQSHLFSEKTANSLIGKKYGKRCETPKKVAPKK